MANTYAGSVVRVDTTGAIIAAKHIKSIKYIGAASGTATVKDNASSSGNTLWEESGTSNVYNSEVNIMSGQGVYVTVANSAVVYLYLK